MIVSMRDNIQHEQNGCVQINHLRSPYVKCVNSTVGLTFDTDLKLLAASDLIWSFGEI